MILFYKDSKSKKNVLFFFLRRGGVGRGGGEG